MTPAILTLLTSTLLTTLGNSHTNFGRAYPEYCDTPLESKYFPLKVELWKNRSRARLELAAWEPPREGGTRRSTIYLSRLFFFGSVLVKKLPVQVSIVDVSRVDLDEVLRMIKFLRKVRT
jgi:hypothetical protein